MPLKNPYELGVGDTFEALVLRDDKPVANQLVYASHAGFHGHSEDGSHVEAVKTRTDGEGVARLQYLRGDRSNEGAGNFYRARSSALGDILHSAPFYVGKPA